MPQGMTQRGDREALTVADAVWPNLCICFIEIFSHKGIKNVHRVK